MKLGQPVPFLFLEVSRKGSFLLPYQLFEAPKKSINRKKYLDANTLNYF